MSLNNCSLVPQQLS